MDDVASVLAEIAEAKRRYEENPERFDLECRLRDLEREMQHLEQRKAHGLTKPIRLRAARLLEEKQRQYTVISAKLEHQ